MKKFLLLLSILSTHFIYSQAQYLSNAVNNPTSVANPDVLLGALPIPNGTFKVYIKDDIKWETYNINNFSTSVINLTSILYKPATYVPSALEITNALGYTPYSNTNPDGFITGYIETDPIWTAVASLYRTKTQNDALYVPLTRTVNLKPLSSDIVLDKTDIGLSNVDNTSDANKPISNATQAALNTKLSAEVDGSITNELQTLSIAGNTISLSNGGGSVVVPVNTYTAGTGINIASNVITNTAPDQVVTLTGGNRIQITGTYPNFTISYIEPTINIINSKTLNSNFTVSTTKQAIVSYSLTCSATNPLVAGNSSATVFLEYSINGGSTWLLPNQLGNLQSVALAVAVAITNGQTASVTGVIPANALVRLRTTINGTASVVFVTGTEIY